MKRFCECSEGAYVPPSFYDWDGWDGCCRRCGRPVNYTPDSLQINEPYMED